MTPTTADVTPPAIVRTAERAPSAARLRNLMVVAALAADTSRESRRAQDAIGRSRSDRLAAPPSERNASPNWLKIALNSQR
jgi:hypothetical protein